MLDFRSDPIIPPDVVGLGLDVWRGNGNNVRQFRGMRHAQGKQRGGGVHHSTADFVGVCDTAKTITTVSTVSLPLGKLPPIVVLRILVKQAR